MENLGRGDSGGDDVISGAQARMARAGLKLTVRDVAEETGLDKNTVSSFENARGAHTTTAQRLKEYFESKGARFTADTCVCLSK